MTHKNMSKKMVSLMGIVLSFLMTFTLLGGTKTSFEAIRNGVSNLFAQNKDGSPLHEKKIIVNGDGTYTLSLDVVGEAEKKLNKANVIIIFDTSSSMYKDTGIFTSTTENSDNLYGLVDDEYIALDRYTWYGNTYYRYQVNGEWQYYTGTRYTRTDSGESRLTAAKSAINKLAKSLLDNNILDDSDTNNDDIIEMALVDFANTATVVNQSGSKKTTNKYSEFEKSVNDRTTNSGGRGTNWEAALQEAKDISFGDDDKTYVIFVSDGNPTFRNTRGNYNNLDYNQDYYRDYSIYGTGIETNSTTVGRCYDHAKDDAKALVDKGYEFCTIGVYGNVSRMKGLTTEAGASESNYYSASDTAGLENALNAILQKIQMQGFGEVEITDGTTSYVETTSGTISHLLVVDESSFKYYKNGEIWPDAPVASLSDEGEVIWDLKSLDVLENGVKYTVTFDVYPSQETYDLVADLKNGTRTYASLDSNIKKYLSEDYSLRTNTTATLTYKDTRIDDKDRTSSYDNPDPISTVSSKIEVEKVWEATVDGREPKDKDGNYIVLSMDLLRDGKKSNDTMVVTCDASHSDNCWKDSKFISTGLLRVNKSTGKVQVLDIGHDYTIEEPASISYHWELYIETVHPMIINGQLTTLIEVTGSDIPTSLSTDENSYYKDTTTNKEYYKFNISTDSANPVYKVYVVSSEGTEAELKAYNYRKSYLDITKQVTGDAPKGKEFEFTFTIDNKIGTNETDDDVWFSVYDESDTIVKDLSVTGATAEVTNGEETGYFYADNKSTITVKMQDGWNLRVMNLGTGSTYTVTENGISLTESKEDLDASNPKYFKLESIDVETSLESDVEYEPEINDSTISGTIVAPDTSYKITYVNNYPGTYITATKEWNGTSKEVEVVLYRTVGNGEEEVVMSNNEEVTAKLNESNNWTYTFEGLPLRDKDTEEPITYNIKEKELDGYSTTYTSKDHEIVITNTELTEVSVKKVWDDANNQDGIRPGYVRINLYANGVKTDKSIDLNVGNTWSHVFTGIPKYQGGEVIQYTVTEEEVESYESEVTGDMTSGYTVTNSHTPEVVSVSGSKTWEDANDQDGIRPESITVHLLADGEEVDSATVTAAEDGSWTYEFTDLPKNAAGEEIEYTVTEDAVEGYTTEIAGYNITNTHAVDKTSVKVSKIWADADNQDGIRPTNVTIELYASNSEKAISSVILSESNNWTYEFKNLDKNSEGKVINYTVKEVEDKVITTEDTEKTYAYEITGSMSEGFTVTNTHTPVEIKLDVEKIWKDENNRDGIRSENITIELYANGDKTEKSLILSDSNDWQGSFENLPKYKEGQEIEYSVNEVSVEGYKVTISEITDGKITITNEHTPNLIKITGEKIWIDSDNQDGKRPEKITVHLLADGEEVDSKEVTGKGNNWTYEFTDLPEYRTGKVGEKVEYTVTEDAVEDYTTNVSKFTITNTHEKETLKINGTKTWDDDNNRDGMRPENITVNLLADGEKIDSKVVTPNADGSWTYDFGTHDKYKNGVIINYTITEDAVENYSTDIKDFNITNTHTPETIDISGSKTWDDADNQDGKRTEEVTIILKADGEEIDRTTASADTDWNYEFTDLPKYKTGSVGQLITYTVSEVEVDGYTTEVDGYNVTNSHTPELLSFTVTKNWEDYENNDGIRPESITVRLFANGEEIDTYEITSENDWTYTFTELPRYSEGKEIEYTITEDEVQGYVTIVSENVVVTNDDQTITINNIITNTHEKETITIEGQKSWEDFNNEYNSRPNEITIYLYKKDELYKTIIVTSETDWKYVIENLDKYADGEEITYTIKEETVEGYETTYDGYNILNTIIWNMGDGSEELPPQTGIEISFNNVLYVIISGVLFILGSYLKHEESK
ncbi:MAG: Cna B-type domain-containing protein [Bacilli bacterium]|nr:Cna B-type domain-containing protein [Bacilli bacterium]